MSLVVLGVMYHGTNHQTMNQLRGATNSEFLDTGKRKLIVKEG